MPDLNTVQEEQPAKEVTLRDIILNTKKLISYFLKYWILLVFLGLAGGVFGYFYAMRQVPTYTAELTFVVEDAKSGGGLGAYSGIASSFGLEVGSGGSGLFQGDNIIQFLNSRLMVQKALLTPYKNDSTKSLADVYFEITGLKEKWDGFEKTKNIHFPPHSTSFTLMQDSALYVLHKKLIGGSLIITRLDKLGGFIRTSCKSTNEIFAKYFVDNLVNEATTFYAQTKTQRSKQNVDNLQEKTDSLWRVINQKTYSAALSQDMNMNPARKMAMVGAEMNTRDKIIAQSVLSEVVKSLEMAKSTLAQETPIIQMIDRPTFPLIIEQKGKFSSTLSWGFGFGFIGLLLLWVRKFIKDMNLLS